MNVNNSLKITLAGLIAAFSITAHALEVDTENSVFQWKGSKKVGSFHTGKISLKSADVKLDDGKISQAQLVMDMTSITNEDLSGDWQTKFLGHIKSGDFFDVEKHPTATLKIDKQVSDSEVTGKLTIKGKSNPVKVKFKKDGNAYTGTFKFDRTKFGIVYGSQNFFKKLVGDKIINDEVSIEFKVVTK